MRFLYATKDAQDKDSLKPRATEYSKSGSDDAAAHEDAAFDPNQTEPETEQKNMGESENTTVSSNLPIVPGRYISEVVFLCANTLALGRRSTINQPR